MRTLRQQKAFYSFDCHPRSKKTRQHWTRQAEDADVVLVLLQAVAQLQDNARSLARVHRVSASSYLVS